MFSMFWGCRFVALSSCEYCFNYICSVVFKKVAVMELLNVLLFLYNMIKHEAGIRLVVNINIVYSILPIYIPKMQCIIKLDTIFGKFCT